MNRFRNRKKDKEVEGVDGNGAPLKSSKTFKKNKKQPQNVEPEFDLTKALPSTDDFRTSLLMPNLSARFSMLREQDDPNSKIGKASDDSVLFPKRTSRLNLFSHNPLMDIDEVSSIKGSMNRPFAGPERTNSFASDGGYGTDEDSTNGGSVMSRAKPGQGNNLFGGRQKLYAIPVASSTSTKTVTSPVLGGKHKYEDDLGLSAFQKYKQKEREEARSSEDEDEHVDNGLTTAEENEPTSSPSTGFSKNRGTISSTNSGPSNNRTSTAATSVDSQPTNGSQLSKTNSQSQSSLDRQATIHRRLYGQALEQIPTRDVFESITRQRAASTEKGPQALLQSKSTTNMNERFKRGVTVYTSSNFRTASPPPSASPSTDVPMDLGIRNLDANVNSTISNPSSNPPPRIITDVSKSPDPNFGYAPPLSPPISDTEGAAALSGSVQPEDRGKATALGLFNKPQKQYDEQQFSQRQIQMHVATGRPLATRTPPPTGALPSIPTKSKSRASSNASTSTGTGSRPPSHNLSKLRESPKLSLAKQEPALPPVTASPPAHARGTFFDNLSQSSESDGDQQFSNPASPIEVHRPTDIHPAFRSNPERLQSAEPHTPSSPAPEDGFVFDTTDSHFGEIPSPGTQPADSPTLGPVGGIGGLIRAHLRQESERSFSMQHHRDGSDLREMEAPALPKSARAWNQPESIHSNPWEYDEVSSHLAAHKEAPASAPAPVPASELEPEPEATPAMTMSEKARQILGQATALREQNMGKFQPTFGAATPASRSSEDEPPSRTWQEEMHIRHNRTPSSETQKDREEFSNEIAERRRRVRENLKSAVELNSRSASPASESRQSKAGNAFAMLRSRPSKPNMTDKSFENSKAMKMLGVGDGNPMSPKTDLWREEEEEMLKGLPKRRGPRSPNPNPAQGYQGTPRQSEEQGRDVDYGYELADRGSPDDKPGFERVARQRYKDDLEQAMDQGQSSRAREFSAPPPTGPLPSHPSADSLTQPAYTTSGPPGRFRSNSRIQGNPPPSNYFDSKTLQPIQGHSPGEIGLSPRPSPSPVTPYSANSTPPLSMDHLPGLTSGELPAAARSTPQLPIQQLSQPPPRKQSINKGMISAPTFISTTSTVPTYGLPNGAQAQTGPDYSVPSPPHPARDTSPPLPAMNPRRRRMTTTQTDPAAPSGRATPLDQPALPRSGSNLNITVPPNGYLPASPGAPMAPHSAIEDRSQYAEDIEGSRQRQRQKLRKSSSEGGSMNARARAETIRSERSPGLPMNGGSPPQAQYQQQQGPPNGAEYRMRSRTPTGGYPPMGNRPPPNMSGMPHMGKPMGWQGPPPDVQYGYGAAAPIPGPPIPGPPIPGPPMAGPSPMQQGQPPMQMPMQMRTRPSFEVENGGGIPPRRAVGGPPPQAMMNGMPRSNGRTTPSGPPPVMMNMPRSNGRTTPSGPPVAMMNGMPRSNGRTTPSEGPMPGMRAPSRQRERPMEGPMF